MNIISHFNEFLKKSFNNFLSKYFSEHNYYSKSSDFKNYFNFINDLDSFSQSFTKDAIVAYFEYIDNVFFNSSYRKNFCSSKGFYERKNFVTLFGNINFKRRYYFDKNTGEYFFFVDLFLGFPKRKHFDPFVCAEIFDKSSSYSYSKAGKLTADKIGSRINSNINISRAIARNICMAFEIPIDENIEQRRVEKLFVMLDEIFVPSQFNNGKDHMIKAAVLFENTELEYKTKKKSDSIDRYRLVNSHTCASIYNDLKDNVYDYIYYNYDTQYLKEIYFMGDCATWIKNFPKFNNFKYNDSINVSFSMDGFHFSQALSNLTTSKNEHWYVALEHCVKNNNKDLFIKLCNRFIDENPDRKITIISKMQYILNNWDERQLYQNKPFLKCSMESHISHIFADIFTSRPKAYSKKGLDKLLNIRLLKINGYDLKQLYLNSIGKDRVFITKSFDESLKTLNLNFSSFDKYDFQYSLPFNIFSTFI